MTGGALEKRRSPRIHRAPRASEWAARAGRPVLVNVSGGGACLWLDDPPFVLSQASFFLFLQSSARKLLMRARLVWMRPCEPSPDGDHEALPAGWLAGVAFAPGQAAMSSDENLGDDVEVDLLPASGSAGAAPDPRRPGAMGIDEGPLPLLDGRSVAKFQDAAETLLPVLAKHFTDVRLVLTRDRLEVSAPFRPIEELDRAQARGQNRPAVEPPGRPIPLPRENHADALSAAPEETQQRSEPAKGWLRGRTLVLVASSILAVAFVGLNVLGVPPFKRIASSTARNVAVQEPARPAWAGEIEASALAGWIDIQTRFGLSEATLRSAIRMLKTNDRYAPGHSFHDLTRYPAQVERAFAIVADRKVETPFDLGALKENLQGRLAGGARFPDETPGSRYFSNLDPRLYDNTIVLAIVELLHRHRAAPDARDLLAALRRS